MRFVKNILIVILSFISISVCYAGNNYGIPFTKETVFNVNEILKDPTTYQNRGEIVLEGSIASVCQKAGCWITINDVSNPEESLFVKFGNHDFTVPKDMTGKVYIHGKIVVNTISVAELKHLAKDAKKSRKEIKKITEPKTEIRFMANGLESK